MRIVSFLSKCEVFSCCVRRLVCAVVAFGGLLQEAGAEESSSAVAARKNVLLIMIDDLRTELGVYGQFQVQSPHIDAFADKALVFQQALCQFPVCAPSRASMLTGLRPTSQRFRDNHTSPQKDAPAIPTLPQVFRENGYHTAGNGKIFHRTSDAAAQSWSQPAFSLVSQHIKTLDPESAKYQGRVEGRGPFFESPDVADDEYIDGQVLNKTLEDLRSLAAKEQPFFLACGFIRPHLPFYAPRRYWDLYDRDAIEIASNRFTPRNAPKQLRPSHEILYYSERGLKYNSDDFHRVARHGYYACVSYVDHLVGELLGEVDRLGLRDETVVVLMGDHGWLLGEHNFWAKSVTLTDALRTVLVIRVPGVTIGAKTDAIVELVDLYPTLCEVAGLPVPDHVEGTSMVPVLQDPTKPWKDAAFATDGKGTTVVTRDYVYTQYAAEDPRQEMLFDLKDDPHENVNCASDPRYRSVLSQMRELLHAGWEPVQPQ